MPRSVARVRTVECSTCHTTETITWWYACTDDSSAAEWNDEALRSLACKCDTPHWSVPHTNATAKVSRGTGDYNNRAVVVYELPDGDYMAPESSADDSPLAQTAREVGIRREIRSIRELNEFHRVMKERKREEWQRMIDDGYFEGTSLEPTYQQMEAALYERARNQVLEYTEESLRNGRDRVREKMAEAREKQVRAQETRNRILEQYGIRIGRGRDNQTYERLNGRRGRR